MTRSRAVAAAARATTDGPARLAERLLRLAGDPRLALALLLVAGVANAVAAALPGGPALLDSVPYAFLLGAIVLTGLAAVAVRTPAAWREWRRPGLVPDGPGALVATLPATEPPDERQSERFAAALVGAGYRVRPVGHGARWTLRATRRGWSRFAALGSHAALVLVLVGVALGAAFGSETMFSLLPGDQALLDAPRSGFTDAVRLEALDAEFGPDGRPRRLDTSVTYVRDGVPAATGVIQVNRPGDFGGYLVHAWTYGPAVGLRVTTLAGRPLLDDEVALNEVRGGRRFGLVELTPAGVALGITLADVASNEILVNAADAGGLIDGARLRPGEEVRIGELRVRLDAFSAYVTFVSRRDPGMAVLLAGGVLLCACLAVAFWLPRRRVSMQWADGELRLVLRGERFERPEAELARLRARLEAAS